MVVKGAPSSANASLHPWLKKELGAIVARLPRKPQQGSREEERALWETWQKGMKERFTVPENPVPLRLLLVLDNLTGHKSVDLIRWFYAHGIMPLYTPLAGGWLNMTESMQRILKNRGLSGQSITRNARRHHVLVGRDGGGLESAAHPLCLGRSTAGAPSTQTSTLSPSRWIRSLYNCTG